MVQEKSNTSEEFIDYRECLQSLGADAEGLSNEEAEKRLRDFGLNSLTIERGDNAAIMFLRQFKSPLVYILILAAMVSLDLCRNGGQRRQSNQSRN
jgi:magnesium-transporting ATPase (P-type)